jgi:uncharacterized protein (TIGR02598 family)
MIQNNHAFSLIEVTLAIGVIAFALIAVVGLIPIGIQSSKDAADDTRASAIAQDAFTRTQSQLNSYVAANAALPSSTQPAVCCYYDNDGRYLNSTPITNYSTISAAIYQAQVTYGPPAAYSGANPTYPSANLDATVLSAVKVSVGWPVLVNASSNTATVSPANAARRVYSFYLRSALPAPSP